MRKISYRSYVGLLAAVCLCLALPVGLSQKMRAQAISWISWAWQGCDALGHTEDPHLLPLEALAQENHLLRVQLDRVREWLLNEKRLEKQTQYYEQLTQKKETGFFERRAHELKELLDLQTSSLFASVIFREPTSWSNSVWIDVGSAHNAKMGKQIVCKNSPVLLGSSVVGLVEYVAERRSLVRLITDASLVISVRALRGEQQNRYLMEQIETLQLSLQMRPELQLSQETYHALIDGLHQLRHKLTQTPGDLYLAKGELRGSSAPLWRSSRPLLTGLGFNYDFADAEGPSRDLRSGAARGSVKKQEPLHLLQPGDLLVTTGLDGLFPPGLRVATVWHTQTLKEGASAYQIEAIPTVEDLDALSHVFVLPPCTP